MVVSVCEEGRGGGRREGVRVTGRGESEERKKEKKEIDEGGRGRERKREIRKMCVCV